MSRLSFGASSAALPGSTRRRAAITGSRSALPCWPAEACVPGQVIGSIDKLAAYPKDRPVWFQNVFATLYHNLGIDPATTVADREGRPMALLDEREPIRELI